MLLDSEAEDVETHIYLYFRFGCICIDKATNSSLFE